MAEGGLGARGVYIGLDLYSSASFYYDPWVLSASGVLTGPSAIVLGHVGRGKSALIKSYLARQAVFGRRCVVIDPKGEYGPLCRLFGAEPIRLEPAGTLRLNPLDPATGREGQLALLAAVVAASLRRALLPGEQAALDLALRAASADGSEPTLPAVQRHLLAPDRDAASSVGATVESLAREGRDCALELRRLCDGDLRGMFDGPTSASIDLDAPVVVLDLSSLHNSPALGVLLVCVAAWLDGQLRRDADVKRIVVLDEGWAVLSSPACAEFVQRSWKLARAYGVQNVLVVHRLSDLRSAGDAGSRVVEIAQGLLSDSETRIVLGQPPSELEATRELVGLTGTEVDHIATLPRGSALWKIGHRSCVVELRLSPVERAVCDTDARMRDEVVS